MPVPDVRYIPNVIPDAERAFECLVAETVWSDRMRARRTASFGRPYNYSGQAYPEAPMPSLIAAIADLAAARAGHAFDNCLCNFYETGTQRMGFHRDSYDELDPASWIAIASLGAQRSLVFRAADRKREVSYLMEPGSILLMNRTTQEHWAHGVPATARASGRISLTFRRFATSPVLASPPR